MTQRRLTKRRAVLERNHADVVGLIVQGKGDPEIAAKYKCRRESVYLFRVRHAEEIAGQMTEVERQTSDYAIAHVVKVIAGMDADWQGLGQVQKQRAADKTYAHVPGYSTGLMAHTFKSVGSGENQELVDEFKVDTAVIAERRALAMAAMQLLGKLPRAGDGSINIDKAIINIVRGAPELGV